MFRFFQITELVYTQHDVAVVWVIYRSSDGCSSIDRLAGNGFPADCLACTIYIFLDQILTQDMVSLQTQTTYFFL